MARTRTAVRPAVLLIAAICALLYANWILAIARFQPNVLFMDQWDYLLPLFNGQGWWLRFVQQQGPVREGLGLIITGWILEATAWDVRYDSLWIATVLLFATVLALRLTWKMTGSIGLRDTWIPLFGLSLGQFETVISVPNVSHSVLPLALILLTAHVWLSPRPAVRYLGAAAAGFLLTFTAFGLFAGGVTAALLGARAVRHGRAREHRIASLAAVGLAVIVVSWVLFARGYVFLPAVEGFRFPWTPMTDYMQFVVLMLNLPTADIGQGLRHYLLGSVLAFVITATTIRIAWIWTRRASLNDDVLVLLMGSGLLFVAFTAIGRVPLGVLGGTASRYLSLMFPLWLAVYLTAALSDRRVLPAAVLCVTVLAVWSYSSMHRRPLTEWPGTLGMTDRQLDAMATYGMSKAAWAHVYLQTGSWEAAQQAVRQPMHPDPRVSHFDDKLRFLRERRLSFFAGQPERGDYLPWRADDRFTGLNCLASGSSQPVCR